MVPAEATRPDCSTCRPRFRVGDEKNLGGSAIRIWVADGHFRDPDQVSPVDGSAQTAHDPAAPGRAQTTEAPQHRVQEAKRHEPEGSVTLGKPGATGERKGVAYKRGTLHPVTR